MYMLVSPRTNGSVFVCFSRTFRFPRWRTSPNPWRRTRTSRSSAWQPRGVTTQSLWWVVDMLLVAFADTWELHTHIFAFFLPGVQRHAAGKQNIAKFEFGVQLHHRGRSAGFGWCIARQWHAHRDQNRQPGTVTISSEFPVMEKEEGEISHL